MATNVRDPLFLFCYEALQVGTITKALPAGPAVYGLGYTRAGTLPGAIGAYVAGLCTKATPATDRAMPVATVGYAIGRVAPGAVIAQDSPLAVNAVGELILATGTNYIVGRSLDVSTGTGTIAVPHWVCVKLT